ncbi:MAG: DUF87 domain-containing protein, partial [Bdellovibrionales bacterium]
TKFQYQFICKNINEASKTRKEFYVWIQSQAIKPKRASLYKLELALQDLEETERQHFDNFREGVQKLKSILTLSGLNPSQLSEIEICNELKDFFRPFSGVKPSQLISLRQADLIIKENTFQYDHTFWVAVSLHDLPDQLQTGQMSNLDIFGRHSLICIKLCSKNTGDITDKLKRQRKISASLANTRSRLRDVESEAKLQSEDELLEALVVGQEKVFDCQMTILFASESDATQKIISTEACDTLRANGLAPYHEAISLYDVFRSCLPGMPMENNRSFLLPSTCVQALLPVFDTDKGHEKPVIHFQDRFGLDMGIDLWDSSLPSYNAIISGTSGSGKSFLSNVLLKNLSEKNDISTFIIDIGASYKRLTEIQGGQYFTFDLNGQNGFNPFSGVSLSDPTSVEASVDILCAIIGDSKIGVSKFERNILLQEISELLTKEVQGLTMSKIRESFSSSQSPFLKNAATILYGWTGDRAYGRLLDNNKNLNTEGRWICFDLRGLNDHVELQRVVMLAVVKRLWDVVRYRENKKILLLDEVWALIQNHAGFIGEAFRTFRKHNASAIAVTQSIEDLATESLTSAVLNNTPTKIILKQSLKPERLQALLNLNSRELEIVRELRSIKGKYSEFFMINGDKKRFLRLEPTADDYWISTTNPQDIEFIKIFMTAHPELTELQACRVISKLYGKERP